jgi:hypothetical protein
MKNPTNIFNFLPYAVAHLKIGPFLEADERAAFNAVLEPTERVWTNPTNIFNFLPYDVTQWKISPFLEADERAAFNAVLEPTERVWRPLPRDFAIKHLLRSFITAQKRHVARIAYFMENSDIVIRENYSRKMAMRAFKDYVRFMSSLQARLIYQYKDKAKKGAFNDLSIFMDDDFPYLQYVTQKFRNQMYDALCFVEESAFIRDVSCTDYTQLIGHTLR